MAGRQQESPHQQMQQKQVAQVRTEGQKSEKKTVHADLLPLLEQHMWAQAGLRAGQQWEQRLAPHAGQCAV